MKLSKNKFLLLICLIFLILGINAVNAEDLENRGDTSDVVSFNVESTSTSVIYVNNSYSGGVEDGSLSSPYKTIESAVSNAANGSEIYVANGDYIESGEISLDKSLSFIGESQNVNISSSSTEPLFSLTEDGVNLVFSNLTFKNINGGTSFSAIRIGGDGTLEMSNCNFYNCSGKYGAIQIWTTSTAVIDNCKFQNISSTKTGGAGAIYTSGSGVYNITNCLVDNTRYNASSGYMYGSIYNYNSRGILNIINTTIKNSQGTANSVIYNKGDLYIINSKIENNIVNKSEYGYQGESIFYNMGNLYINSSVISNNSGSDYVFYQGSFDCIISGSAFLNNNYSDSFNDATITANYNWWGTNDKPNDFVENWIIMDYTIDSTSPTVGEEITITANFNKYMDDKGTYDLTNPVADGIKVEFSDSNGKIDSEAFTVDGKASVSYTVNADDVIYIKSGNLTLNVPITVQTHSKSIYVSTKGNDANNGSQESPVKTIAKAIELSKDLGEPVDIIIEEGTYQENYLNISDDLSFIGEGEVKIDGSNSQNSLFIIKGGNVLFENINFQNVNLSSISRTNGGAILIQADSNRQTVYANVTINNCNFNNLSVASQGGAVYVEYGSGNLNINNSNFTNCSTDSSNGGAIKVDMGYNLFNTHIENSNFKDNYANNAAVYIRGNSSTIINCIFDGNGAKYYPGALQIYNTTTLIDGCTFINNYADSSSSNTVSAIHINEGSNDNNKVTIKNSIFENNNATTDSCPSIYVNKGTLDISNSYIDSALAIKTYYYYSSYSQSTTQGVAIANNNWWGTNNPRSVVNGNNITIDSWVIMSVNADIPDELKVGDVVEININFNHVNTTTGEIAELNGSIPKEFNVSINANGGTAAKSVTTVNGETSFNYTVTEITNNFVNLTVDKTSTIFNVVKVVYNGTIYVSTTGNDNNIGSSDAPVKTIAKAIELATAEGGSGQIIIKEGTYSEYGLEINGNLTITGEDEVIINASSQGRLFSIGENSNVVFNNLALTGASSNFGAVIYNAKSSSSVNLTNVKIYNNTVEDGMSSTLSVLYNLGGNLTIVNSSIYDNGENGLIYTEGNLIINNSNIYNNIANAYSSVYGAVYVYDGNAYIYNSTFRNITSNQGTIFGYTDTHLIIENSLFEENIATVGDGAAIHSNNNLTVSGSSFIRNSGTGFGSEGGAIYSSGTAIITSSIFIDNNVSSDNEGSAIYNYGEQLTVNNCVLISNSSASVIYNDGGEESSVNAQYNWWGTNNNPQDLVGSASGYWPSSLINVSNWVILNVTTNPSQEFIEGNSITINVDLNHYYDNETGSINELTTKLPDGFSVSVESENGTFTSENIIINEGVGSTVYIPISGDNRITFNDNIVFEFNADEQPEGPTTYTVTNSTFFNFFDEDGNLLANVSEGSVLNFVGEFGGLPDISSITIDREMTINGVNAKLNDIFVQLSGSNIVMDNFTIVISGESGLDNGVIIMGDSIKLVNNFINVTTSDNGGYAVLAGSSNGIVLDNNTVYFYGNGGNRVYTRGIDISSSSKVEFINNNFEFNIPSFDIGWDASYNADVKSLAMILDSTENFTIINNTIKTLYNGVSSGSFDTMYGVYISMSYNGLIDGNEFYTDANNYGYSLVISGAYDYNSYDYVYCDNVNITNNNITSISSDYGSWGIQAQVGTGIISNNNVEVIAEDAVYGIYTEGYMGPTTFDIYNNTISASANCVWAISSAGMNETIGGNEIIAKGNFTIGIYSGPFGSNIVATIENNTISSLGSGAGDITGGMPEKIVTGIYIFRYGALINNNNVTTTGDYSVYIVKEDSGAIVENNYLIANNTEGDSSVFGNGTNIIRNNLPAEPQIYDVTNDTFFNFFDEDGNLLANITAGSVLNFVGEFGGLPDISSITIDREMTINGVNAKLNDIFVQLNGSNIVMDNFTIVISGESGLDNGVIIMGDSIKLVNNFINVTTPENGGYAIIMDDVNGVVLDNNTVYYNGNGSQDSKYYGVSISSSNNIELTNNDFEFWIPSLAVGYDASYNSEVKSLGLLIENSEDYAIVNNSIRTYYNGKYNGSWDTIYGVYISKSSNGLISGNNITIEGREYSYALSLIGALDYTTFEYVYCDNVNVTNNNINAIIAGYGSWGIQAQLGSGVISNNDIEVIAEDAVYGIYTEGMMGSTSFDMINNTISASANSVWAISSAGQNETISGNEIIANGNYTIGIYSGPFGSDIVATIENNTISSLGSGIGDITGGMPDKVVTGIYIYRQGASITNNNVTTTGNFTVIIESENGVIVRDNYLIADTAKGNPSVLDDGSNTVENNLPMFTGIIYVDVNGNDLNDGSIDAPVKTIAKAIELALVEGGSGHIIIGSGVFEEHGLENSKDLLIEGAGSGETIINGSNLGEIFTNSFASLTLRGISLINGNNTESSGGSIVSMGNLTLEDVSISNSISTSNGGAIYAVGNLIIRNSEINSNVASGNGGAIYIDEYKSLNYPSSLIIENSDLSNNVAESSQFGGGAIYMQLIDGDKVISNTSFINNKANAGGAIFMQQSEGDFTISDSRFEYNEITSSQDTYGGGAICLIGQTYSKEGNVIITGSKFINNNATTSAGAIFTRNVDLNISKSFIINNKDAEGSAIVRDVTSYYPSGATVTVEDNWWGNTVDNLTFNSTILNNINTPESWLILNMSFDNEEFTIGDIVEVTVDLTHNQNGELVASEGLPTDSVNINYNGTSQIVTLENGIAKAIVTVVDLDENNVEAELYGIIINSQLLVKLNPSITVSVEDIEFGENATIIVNLNQNATGNVTITIGNFIETLEVINGTASLTVENLNVGIYDVFVSYSGDSNYVSAVNSTSFNVIGFVLSGSDVVMYYKNGTEYVVVLTDVSGNYIANKTLTFIVNNVEYTRVTDENGSASMVIGLNAGEYLISVIYNDCPSVNVTNTITVLPTVDADDIIKYYRNDTQYSAIILDGQGNPVADQEVSFNINGVFYYITTDENGRASLNINLNPGNYTLTVNNTVTGELYSNNVEVLSTIIVDNLVKYFHNDSQYDVTVLDGQGNPIEGREVSFNVNGIIYTRVTDESGRVSLNINLNPGEYIMTVTDVETGLNVSSNITVLSTIISSDIVKYFRNGTQYHAKLVDGQGNPIEGRMLTFNINGVFYNRETNSEGIATLNINLNPGKYIITAIDQYSGLMMSNNIEVLPILIGENQIIHYASGETYDVTLLDSQGKPLVGEDVSININGIFYNKVTDANGIAKLNINLLPGKYIATVYYGAAAVSNEITVV